MNQIASEPRPLSEDTRLIPLTQGQFAIVDAADYDWLSQWKWFASWCSSTKSFYAARNSSPVKGKHHWTPMHRLILGLERGNKMQGDHISRDTLDNRRSNLRVATISQNQMNRPRQRNNTTGFKGVSFHKHSGKYQAHIRLNHKLIYLGLFPNAELSHEAYKVATVKYHGEFSCHS